MNNFTHFYYIYNIYNAHSSSRRLQINKPTIDYINQFEQEKPTYCGTKAAYVLYGNCPPGKHNANLVTI